MTTFGYIILAFIIATFLFIAWIVFKAVSESPGKPEPLPTAMQYAEQNPDCLTSRGYKCCNCGSLRISIKESNIFDVGRCNSCGMILYRVKKTKPPFPI